VTSIIRALPFVLVATAGCAAVHAQQLTCYPIRSGESASSIARRLTGDTRNRHQPWFHVVEPTTGRIISKRRYEHIQAGWQVCLGSLPSGGAWGRSAYLPVAPTSGALLQAAPTQPVSCSVVGRATGTRWCDGWMDLRRAAQERVADDGRRHERLRQAIRRRVRASAISTTPSGSCDPLATTGRGTSLPLGHSRRAFSRAELSEPRGSQEQRRVRRRTDSGSARRRTVREWPALCRG
jgi:hypothetical protein